MRLKRLTLHGFKSFADRTEFEFDHGLTGIIGPNGCGKSNVVDAVKWVLGDQRPTSLRGKEMLDVIFNGAEGRPAMGCSEVTLVLERAAELPEGGSQLGSAARDESNGKPVELSVGRRLYRSGESEYLLNNRIVRLKDVREAMMDTGLGVGAYSVMEQGRIDAVLSANPEDRRMIFDEAAGISRYKLRRKEALRKLDRTEQNLARVKDLRGEKATRVRSLKIQATRARNYRETDERLMAIRVALAMSRSAEIRETLGEHEAAIAEADASLQRASRARDATRRVLVDGERELRELSGCQAGIKDLLAELRAEERSRREALANGEERLERLARLRERAGGEVERVTGLAAQSLADALELEKGLEELARTLASAEDAYPGLETEAQSAKQALAQLHAERDRLQQALLACLHERTRAKNCVREEELKAQARDARRARIHAQLGELKGRLEESRRQGNSEWQVLLDLEERCRRVAGRIARESETGTRLESRRDELMERVRALGNERSALASQLELLEELEASQQGLDEAARELLADGPGILGRLVEQLECPLEVSAALEAALGSRVQALLAADPPCEINRVLDARATRQGGGHLELLEVPPDTGETTPPAADPGELPPDGRPLLEFCRLGAQVREPLTRLLGGVRLVRDLETARRLAAQEGGGTIYVTPRGELCEGAWISGGKSEAAAGLLQRKSALERLRTELERANAAHAELDAEEEDLARRWERLRGQRERLARLAEALDKKHASVE
ncbi:MAG: chromosome segregation SMC family protein, partial [Planctomycetota bacterium]